VRRETNCQNRRGTTGSEERIKVYNPQAMKVSASWKLYWKAEDITGDGVKPRKSEKEGWTVGAARS